MTEPEFQAFYTMVGIFNSCFLFLYAFANMSKLMKWSTRSCEEIFAVFTSAAFMKDAINHISKAFKNYYSPANITIYNMTVNDTYSTEVVELYTELFQKSIRRSNL